MTTEPAIKILNISQKDGYHFFSLQIEIQGESKEYEIYAFDKDIPLKESDINKENLEKFATDQVRAWLNDSDGKFPKDKYRVLINGGKITTDRVEGLLSINQKVSDLVRTNVTIYAPLFEWAKDKAKKEGTSFSDLVSRGLLTLKDSDKEIELWFKEQGAYFRGKLGDYGSYEFFHYLPNNYKVIDTDTLKDTLQKVEIRRTGWPIGAYLTNSEQRPFPQDDGIKAEYAPSDYLLLDYWYAKNKGEFYFARNFESDSGNGEAKPKTSFYFDTLVWRVAEFLEHCLAYYQNLGIEDGERVKIKMSLNSLAGRTLSAWNQMRAFTLRHYTCGSDKSSWETELTLKELQGHLDDVIYDSVKKLLLMFDFFVPNKEVVLDILNREYRKSNY